VTSHTGDCRGTVEWEMQVLALAYLLQAVQKMFGKSLFPFSYTKISKATVWHGIHSVAFVARNYYYSIIYSITKGCNFGILTFRCDFWLCRTSESFEDISSCMI
jgi:hypothetical protein